MVLSGQAHPSPMLTGCWQQHVFIPGQHCIEGVMTMMMLYGLGLATTVLPLLTPWWQQHVRSVRRLLRRSGVLS
jgi:hypothetical protein